MSGADVKVSDKDGPREPADQPAIAPRGGQPPTAREEAALASLNQDLQRLPLSDDLIDWIGFVRRQWALMLVVWVLMMVLVVAALYVWPRQYESSAKFLVKNARADLVVAPTDAVTGAYREELSETVLNTELELLKSRDILIQVVRALNLDQALIDSGRSPEMAEQMAVQGLSGGLLAYGIRRTNVIQMSYTSRDPELAASIVRHVADAYLAAHLVIHSSPGTYEMFKSQAADASAELRRAEEELAALARSSNLVILDSQKQEALSTVHAMEAQLNTLAVEMREHETRARIAEIHMSRTPQRVPTTQRNMPNQSSVERLHTMIAELTNKRTEALTKFQPTDRLVVELDKQIADTTASLERAQQMGAIEESTGINPAWQQLEAERTKARLQLAGLESKAAALEHELADQRLRTLEITEAGPRYEQLVRNVTEAKNRYELFTKRTEEARIAEVLDRQRISNVVLAQAPVVSYVPSKPNVRLGLVAGAILAAFVALGIAFLREFFGFELSRRRRRPADVSVLGISPAPAELP